MLQVLFHIPGTSGWFPPDGIPVHGFGVMLFFTFILCVWFLGWRSRRTGTNLPKERVIDLVIVGFVLGLLGARITFMIQYRVPADRIFRIWEGGIVLYGGIIAGILTFLGFYYLVLKKSGVSFWKLVDVTGPTLALGIALGRIGCFLNGCCYGHVAPEGCPSVGFPLLTAPARDVVVDRQSYQTPTGFTVRRDAGDIRSVVDRVEPGSAAERAGLKPGDRIVGVNGKRNVGVFIVNTEDPKLRERVAVIATGAGAAVEADPQGKANLVRLVVDDVALVPALRVKLNGEFFPFQVRIYDLDLFTELIETNWPRGDQSLTLVVERGGTTETVGPFTPRTLGLHPTQLYEVISMVLLIAFLLAYYPYRNHDGQLFTLFIVVYAVHRFMNESLRNDTDVVGIQALNMTLSQNISVLMLLFAAGMEIGRRWWLKKHGPDAATATKTVAQPS